MRRVTTTPVRPEGILRLLNRARHPNDVLLERLPDAVEMILEDEQGLLSYMHVSGPRIEWLDAAGRG
jgi:hypothetical protein